MGRKFPIGENPTINPILSFSLLIACVASIIAIISSLCGSFLRKKESSPERNFNDVFSVTKAPSDPLVTSPAENTDGDDVSSIMSHSYQKPKPPPPPPEPPEPDMRHSRASSYHFQSNSTTSSLGGLTSSMSMRVQGGGLSGLRQSSRRADSNKKKEKYFKHEDSIWKKQIILGEKCRVPDEDDTIICDEKGNKISTYHPKTPSSLTLSRQSSSIDPNAIPS